VDSKCVYEKWNCLQARQPYFSTLGFDNMTYNLNYRYVLMTQKPNQYADG
jgi:hypothetical protein